MLAGYDGDSRIGLFDRALTLTGPDGQQRRTLGDADALGEVLGRLGLDVNEATRALLWQRLAATG